MTDITDYLMKQADEADRKADEYFEQSCNIEGTDEVDRAALLDRATFHRGQASGFRQATFIVMQHEGTPTHD